MEASSVTGLLFKHLSFRSDRQNVISSNIANVNTPAYKTKDLVFEDELSRANKQKDLDLFVTNTKHINPSLNQIDKLNEPRLVEVKGLKEQNDGNNVSLDNQMSEMSKNKIIFDAIQSSIKKDSRLFRSVIESSQKN
ncbi:flagellar basal body rod protein FlgB [Halarcobacter bivalviorum]|uniref:Flagellar basal body rod protein FlgB n=1 Tax=Halarcobacter bivalviorum TaxID=663364 RepID=A0AAX2A9H7_9BACT|nr:flagellar basal body rod protein FlgB [Halarcobacter bivalviorum]AXH11474.1 flagellar proximal rod protein FlgB [Halarcobacter bivalviorum]RXK09341.1 flagellar basal body rod protein FlgB [Halarcobacter bivalviorum]